MNMDNFLNIGMYMHLQNQPRLRKSNSEAVAAARETLLLSYPQVHAHLNALAN